MSPSNTTIQVENKKSSMGLSVLAEKTLKKPEGDDAEGSSVERLKARNTELEAELQASKVDAKETLLALLQMAEGVRVITKHMQNATYNNDTDGTYGEESKSNELTEQLFSDSIVKETCLRRTVFGTDLLRLWGAADHVRAFARMVVEESKISSEDVVQAQTTAQESLQRAEQAEAAVRALQVQNATLSSQLSKTVSERRVLLKEVKTLRQQMAVSRKIEMERLLQQHVEGALLVHEGHLKAMAAQHQRLKHAEQEERDQEELELVQAEDCQAESCDQHQSGENAKPAAGSTDGKEAKVTSDDVSEIEKDGINNRSNVDENRFNQGNQTKESSKEELGLMKSGTDSVTGDLAIEPDGGDQMDKNAAPESTPTNRPVEAKTEDVKPVRKPNNSLSLAGGSLIGFGSQIHRSWAGPKATIPKPQCNTTVRTEKDPGDNDTDSNMVEGPSGQIFSITQEATSIENAQMSDNQKSDCQWVDQSVDSTKERDAADSTAASKSYTPVKLFPSFGRTSPVLPQAQAAKSQGHGLKPDSSRSIGSAASVESNNGPGVGTKVINFIFYPERTYQQQQQHLPKATTPVQAPAPKKQNALLNLDVSKDGSEKDIASIDNTALSTMATLASSCADSRARTLSEEENKTTENQKSAPSPMRIIPGSVSWSEDTRSVESNLPSPQVQRSPKEFVSCDSDVSSKGAKYVELYKDMKVFQSLAIPTDDEIEDYHYYQHQYQREQQAESTS